MSLEVFRFADCEVSPLERQLRVRGQRVPIGARAFDMLVTLIERRDRVVTKTELLGLVWAGLFVEENNLQVHVHALRKALGRQCIATIPGYGYRFTARLDADRDTASPQPLKAGANMYSSTRPG